MNRVFLVGRLANDPTFDVYVTSGGEERPNIRFRLAVNRSYVRKNDPGQKADFINVHLWGKRATSIVEYLYKGREVAVSGELRIDEKRGNDGSYDNYVFVNADDIQLLGSSQRSSTVEAYVPDEYGLAESQTV